MANVNLVILVGRLGADPELKQTTGGRAVATFNVATDEKWKDASGTDQQRTEWHRCVAWGGTAEVCAKYLAKGREVYIEGKNQTDKYKDKEGIDRWSTKVVVRSVQFIGAPRTEKDGAEPRGAAPSSSAPAGGAGIPDDDEIPF